MSSFDPNAAASEDSGIFGLPPESPHTLEDAKLVYLPVPWEATTSYGGGTSDGPGAILEASRQVDLFDGDVLRPYEPGLFCLPESSHIRDLNRRARLEAQKVIAVGGQIEGNRALVAALHAVNTMSAELDAWVHAESLKVLKAGKILALIGGDHSVPFGAMKAQAEVSGDFGVLHFDAHSDTRRAYEGFEGSHASIFYNVATRIPAVKRIVQVGIRDFCEEEDRFTRERPELFKVWFDRKLKRQKADGIPFTKTADAIVADLPSNVWVSFDIDGLDPKLCPHTGTPVPGGLEFWEATSILSALVRSGRTILGFDLNEVAPGPDGDEWDANVGARLLYKLTGFTLASRKHSQLVAGD